MRLESRTAEERKVADTSKSRPRSKLILPAVLLVAPLMGASCTAEASSQSAKSEVSCSKPEQKAKVGPAEMTVKGGCVAGEIVNVEMRIPCGSRRFQESCLLTLPVPSTAVFVRNRDAPRMSIVVTTSGDGATVEISNPKSQ